MKFGFITSRQTINEAFHHACEALDVHLERLRKLGKRIPKARYRLVVEAVQVIIQSTNEQRDMECQARS